MNSRIGQLLTSCAAVAALAAALALAGCGRKPGQLDPPQASAPAKPADPAAQSNLGMDALGRPIDPNQKPNPTADAKGRPLLKKDNAYLDWIIN